MANSQTSKPCTIHDCDKGGRVLARLGSVELTYCGHHRKYGERVINFLVNSVFRNELTDFLSETKQDLFMDNLPRLSDESYTKLGSYVDTMIHKLDKIEEWDEKRKK